MNAYMHTLPNVLRCLCNTLYWLPIWFPIAFGIKILTMDHYVSLNFNLFLPNHFPSVKHNCNLISLSFYSEFNRVKHILLFYYFASFSTINLVFLFCFSIFFSLSSFSLSLHYQRDHLSYYLIFSHSFTSSPFSATMLHSPYLYPRISPVFLNLTFYSQTPPPIIEPHFNLTPAPSVA